MVSAQSLDIDIYKVGMHSFLPTAAGERKERRQINCKFDHDQFHQAAYILMHACASLQPDEDCLPVFSLYKPEEGHLLKG